MRNVIPGSSVLKSFAMTLTMTLCSRTHAMASNKPAALNESPAKTTRVREGIEWRKARIAAIAPRLEPPIPMTISVSAFSLTYSAVSPIMRRFSPLAAPETLNQPSMPSFQTVPCRTPSISFSLASVSRRTSSGRTRFDVKSELHVMFISAFLDVREGKAGAVPSRTSSVAYLIDLMAFNR